MRTPSLSTSTAHRPGFDAQAALRHHSQRIIGHVQQRVLPILLEWREQLGILGSGALVRRGAATFLLTARHVAESRLALGTEHTRLLLPRAPGSEERIAFEPGQLRCATDLHGELDADVCALLLPPRAARELLAHWQPIGIGPARLRGGARRATAEEMRYLVSGYPIHGANPTQPGHPDDLVHLCTRQLAAAPVEAMAPVHPALDLFFEYSRRGSSADGGDRTSLPRLEGVSGAPVWCIMPAQDADDWSPDAHLQPIGIQTSYRHSAYLRAKDWALARELLRRRGAWTDLQLPAAARFSLAVVPNER